MRCFLASGAACSNLDSVSSSQRAFRFLGGAGVSATSSSPGTVYLELRMNLPLFVFLTFATWSWSRTVNSSVVIALSLARFLRISSLYALLPFLGWEAGIWLGTRNRWARFVNAAGVWRGRISPFLSLVCGIRAKRLCYVVSK